MLRNNFQRQNPRQSFIKNALAILETASDSQNINSLCTENNNQQFIESQAQPNIIQKSQILQIQHKKKAPTQSTSTLQGSNFYSPQPSTVTQNLDTEQSDQNQRFTHDKQFKKINAIKFQRKEVSQLSWMKKKQNTIDAKEEEEKPPVKKIPVIQYQAKPNTEYQKLMYKFRYNLKLKFEENAQKFAFNIRKNAFLSPQNLQKKRSIHQTIQEAENILSSIN